LITTISTLAESNKLPVIYFTQGHNELDINDTDAEEPGVGGGILRQGLERRHVYEVKPLSFDAVEPRVPDDATLVVVAGNQIPFSQPAVKALRDYMSRNGKMMILLATAIESGKGIKATGLEDFLAEYGIRITPERLLTLPVPIQLNAVQVVAQTNPRLTGNVLAMAFRQQVFAFDNARPLQIAPPAGGRFMAQPLLLTRSRSFPEANVAVAASKLIDDIMRDRAVWEKKAQECKPEVIGAVVTESSFDPNDPHAGMRGMPTEQKPRMVVFGTATMASNRRLLADDPLPGSLIASSIEWLRDKPARIGVEPKKRNSYELPKKSDTELTRMIFLPPCLVLACILGVATGVWVVRRR
jgi:hypothetical protein